MAFFLRYKYCLFFRDENGRLKPQHLIFGLFVMGVRVPTEAEARVGPGKPAAQKAINKTIAGFAGWNATKRGDGMKLHGQSAFKKLWKGTRGT